MAPAPVRVVRQPPAPWVAPLELGRGAGGIAGVGLANHRETGRDFAQGGGQDCIPIASSTGKWWKITVRNDRFGEYAPGAIQQLQEFLPMRTQVGGLLLHYATGFLKG